MHFNTNSRNTGLALIIAISALAAGCASDPYQNRALRDARDAYQAAMNDPDIAKNAPVALHDAGKALKKAEKAEDDADIKDLAYLASKKTEQAVAIANRKLAEQKMERLSKEKDQVVLRSREREAERAKREAEIKAREAEIARERAELERARVKELEKQLLELQAKKTDRGLVLTLGDVLFASGKANLLGGAMHTIDKLADFLNENPGRKVLIEGHTDSRGSEEYNLTLSQHRADAVRLALLTRNVRADRIRATGYGESTPVADNASEAGRQRNRRVEIIIQDGNE
ncbi:MAG: OmpA family protein [Gammaproteobacteria bacterium]|nr:OmpA family protein [Gammaproteobacteria bacterium]